MHKLVHSACARADMQGIVIPVHHIPGLVCMQVYCHDKVPPGDGRVQRIQTEHSFHYVHFAYLRQTTSWVKLYVGYVAWPSAFYLYPLQ